MSADGPEDDAATSGEHALGLLPPAERAAFEARLASEPALRRLVAQWEEDLAGLAEDVEPIAPPAHVRRGIERRLFPRRRRLWPLGLLAAGAVAASIWFGVGLDGFAPAVLPVEIAAGDRALVIAARFDPGAGTLALERLEGEAPSGRVLELWLIAGEAAPVSLGVLPQAGEAALDLSPSLAALVPGATLAVSEEPLGGSPTGAPTGAVLATGVVPRA